jgi:limonene-1,2-epoxide hydrolase
MAERVEDIVRAFLDAGVKGDIEQSLSYFAEGGSYQMDAWHEPFVGIDAIRGDFERQRTMWTDLRIELVNTASTGNIVFTERIDTVHMAGKDLVAHMVGVFEINADGKITSWRDYFDTKEVEAQLVS